MTTILTSYRSVILFCLLFQLSEKAIDMRREELDNQLEVLMLENRSLKERNQHLMVEINKKAQEVTRVKLR